MIKFLNLEFKKVSFAGAKNKITKITENVAFFHCGYLGLCTCDFSVYNDRNELFTYVSGVRVLILITSVRQPITWQWPGK